METEKTFKLADYETKNIYEVRAKSIGPKVWQTNCCFPSHKDDTNPSLTIYEETGQYHCFGCNKHGKLWDEEWVGQKVYS